MMTTTTSGDRMTTDDMADGQMVGDLRLPDDLASPRLLVELSEAAHAALRAAQQGWVAHLEDGPGEAESPVTYGDPSESRVAAQVAATAMVEHLKAVAFARPAKLPPDPVAQVPGGLRYKLDWSF